MKTKEQAQEALKQVNWDILQNNYAHTKDWDTLARKYHRIRTRLERIVNHE